jgi:hypothetical protein
MPNNCCEGSPHSGNVKVAPYSLDTIRMFPLYITLTDVSAFIVTHMKVKLSVCLIKYRTVETLPAQRHGKVVRVLDQVPHRGDPPCGEAWEHYCTICVKTEISGQLYPEKRLQYPLDWVLQTVEKRIGLCPCWQCPVTILTELSQVKLSAASFVTSADRLYSSYTAVI